MIVTYWHLEEMVVVKSRVDFDGVVVLIDMLTLGSSLADYLHF